MRQRWHHPTHVCVFLLTGSSLFGQTGPNGRFPDHKSIRVITSGPGQQPNAGSNIITIHELRHNVPAKARKEMVKAERDRVKNRVDEAIGHYSQAISIDPEFIAARNNLAVTYLTVANLSPAIAQLEKAITIDPENSILFGNLTLGYVMSQRFVDAERAARVAASIDRTGCLPKMLLGMVLVEQQKYTEEALQYLERAGREYPLAHLLAGRVFIALGKAESARSEILTYLSGKDLGNRAIANQWLDFVNRNQPKTMALIPH
jgi:tetratricopeptide (TPR) repeat protein